MLNCSHEFPVLDQLPEAQYIVNHISYETRSLRVYDSSVSSQHDNDCVPIIRNTTLPTAQFNFAENVTKLRLFSNCSDSLSVDKDNTSVVCDAEERGRSILDVYDGDENVASALRKCETNSVAPVEEDSGGPEIGKNVVQVLRRGFVIKWTASDCSKCESSGGRCGFNETTYMFRCFCPDRPRYRSCRSDAEKDGSNLILAAAIFGGGVILLLCMLISFVIWRCKERLKNASDHLSKSDIESRSLYFGTHIFSYKELMAATNNFDSSQEVGDGGFGTVYYGKLVDGREVAIKRLYEHNTRRVEQFMNEIKILTCLRHKNLVCLYGCTSTTSKELLLVYEFVLNGTVADHLHGERGVRSPLSWGTRMKIAIETASALAYLHRSDIIHRDVKTSNILLDSNFCVKVADFGLSRLSINDATHISAAPQGTPGYVDPSYHQSYHLTSKSDVYSFGVVLVELVSSMPAVDISRHTDETNLANLAVSRIERRAFGELIDHSLGFHSDVEVARMTTSVADLAFRCLQLDKDSRPSMDEVLNLLTEIQGAHEFQFHTTKQVHDIITSPQTDDIVLMKKRNFQSSPNAVTDRWTSNSTTTTSHKSIEM